MFQLIYTSTAQPILTPDALCEIARQAAPMNERDGLTGILMMSDGILMQALEGSEVKVRALYRRILRDERHTDCEILLTRDCDRRMFGDWSMACCQPDDDDFKLKLTITELRQRRDADTLPLFLTG